MNRWKLTMWAILGKNLLIKGVSNQLPVPDVVVKARTLHHKEKS